MTLPTDPLTAQQQAQCHTLAAWLHAVLKWAPLAWLLQLLCLACWLAGGRQPAWLPWAVLALALAERWYAMRLRLDARLFDLLGKGDVASPAALQHALHQLGLKRQPANAAPRPLADMVRGCQRLVGCYAACVLALLVLAGIALLMRNWV